MTRLATLVEAGETRGKDRVAVQIEGRELVLSNLHKVLYPQAGFTKGDVIDHYLQAAPTMLTHLADRPVTRKRYPNGVDEAFFFEKNVPKHRPDWVETVVIPAKDKPVEYCVCSDTATLVWLANLAALELHTNLGSAAHPEVPQYVVFDLDPGPAKFLVWDLRAVRDHHAVEQMPVVGLIDLRGALHRLRSQPDLVSDELGSCRELAPCHFPGDRVGIIDGEIGPGLR